MNIMVIILSCKSIAKVEILKLNFISTLLFCAYEIYKTLCLVKKFM